MGAAARRRAVGGRGTKHISRKQRRRRGKTRRLLVFSLGFLAPLSLAAQFPSIQELPAAYGGPNGIATGPDGNLWVAENATSRISKVSKSGAPIAQFSLSAGSQPVGIVAGPDGNLWFAEAGTSRIGKMTPGGTILGEFSVGGAPEAIAAGSDGNLWFTEPAANRIGKMDTSGRLLGEFRVPTSGGTPRSITPGPCGDKHLWFTEQVGRIGRIDTAGNIAELANTGLASNLQGITAGPPGDCNLWVTDRGQDCVVRMTMSGQFLVIFLAIGSNPIGITAAADGNLWYAETSLNRIGYLPAAGGFPSILPVPSPATSPEGIALGPDGNIWFTESVGNRVGRVLTGAPLPPTPTPTPPPGVTILPRHATPGPRPFRTPSP